MFLLNRLHLFNTALYQVTETHYQILLRTTELWLHASHPSVDGLIGKSFFFINLLDCVEMETSSLYGPVCACDM